MKCPNCKAELTAFKLDGVQVHVCDACRGFWLTRDELQKIKNKIPDDAWFDLDIWDDKEKMAAKKSDNICPVCNISLYSLDWDNSRVVIELCKQCNGVWVGREDFNKIVSYIDQEADKEVLFKYKDTLKTKVHEVFTGPKHLVKEVHDVLTFLNMFKYKMIVQDPRLTNDLINLPQI